jgi:alcohol dehydrogenase, propanol-preferring
MRALVLTAPGHPQVIDVDEPRPGPGQVLLRVRACGVCRTDLHITDGEVTSTAGLPRILGHQVVAVREDTGERVGVPWLGGVDGTCRFCVSGHENLCDAPTFTGLDVDGGFAEAMVADEWFCLPLPESYGADTDVAPLLCAGLIGHRTLRMAGDPARLGIYGFGAAAHIVCQVAVWEGREVYGVTRAGDTEAQELARSLGAVWAGGPDDVPVELDAALIFAPAGELVPAALRAVGKGGVVVCGGIHMSDIPSFPYELLWGERVLRSVANLTRADGHALLELAPRVPIRTHVTTYGLERAADALDDLRGGRIVGAAVVVPGGVG